MQDKRPIQTAHGARSARRLLSYRRTTADATPEEQPPTITDAVALFHIALVARSPRTAANYRSALKRYLGFLDQTHLPPTTLSTHHLPATTLEDFYTWLLTRPLLTGQRLEARKRSATTYVAGTRAFLAFLDRRRWLPPDVSYEHMKDGARSAIGKTPYPTPRVSDDVARIVTCVFALPVPPRTGTTNQERLILLRDRAILATLYATAMRRAEVCALNRADVQDGRTQEALVTGKGNKERLVFFDGTALLAIRAYLEERHDSFRPLFMRHDDRRGTPGAGGERYRLSPQAIWRVVKHYSALAGVDATTHHVRHLKARVLLNNGMPLAVLQDILGHSSPDTTKRVYAPYTQSSLRQAVERYTISAEVVAQRTQDRAEQSDDQPG